jgi:hypothetical protein
VGRKTIQNKKSLKSQKKSYTRSETCEGQKTLGRTEQC